MALLNFPRLTEMKPLKSFAVYVAAVITEGRALECPAWLPDTVWRRLRAQKGLDGEACFLSEQC